MKFFIDTANIEQIKKALDFGILDGVTTNPSLMAKEGVFDEKKKKEHYLKICQLVDGDISAEVLSLDYKGMIKEGEELSKLHSNIVVKIPITKDGIKATKHLTSNGIRVNVTLVFSVGQALLAAKAGATYVSPFVGRLDDISEDGIKLIEKIIEIFSLYSFDTEVLAASIRHTNHIIRCLEVGADVVTCPLGAIMGLLNHPLTDSGLEKFMSDINNVK